MKLSNSKILALLLAAGYTIGAYFQGDGSIEASIFTALCMIFPIGCIFFSDFMSQHSRRMGSTRPKTPAAAIRFVGWLLLIIPLIVVVAGLFTRVTGTGK